MFGCPPVIVITQAIVAYIIIPMQGGFISGKAAIANYNGYVYFDSFLTWLFPTHELAAYIGFHHGHTLYPYLVPFMTFFIFVPVIIVALTAKIEL